MRIKKTLVIFTLLISVFSVSSQEVDSTYRKNAFLINVTNSLSNEYNIGFERYFSRNTSLEINGGPVRSNPAIAEFSQSWTNSLYFYESGYTARIGLKFYKKKSVLSKWQDYVSPVIFFKSLAFEPHFFETKYENNERYQGMFLKRQRSKFGFEFLWGKVYPVSKTFNIELYYGVGLRATMAERTDFWRIDTMPYGNNPGTDTTFLNFNDNNFYVRPSIHGGLKLRFNY